MPSPIGHALAGAALAWSLRGMPGWKPAALCALFAGAARHRSAVHADPPDRDAQHPVAVLVTIIAVAVTGWVKPGAAWSRLTGGTPPRRLALACGLAWSSHIVLDWLGADASPPYGIQALWPFSDSWFFSGLDVFPGTERRQPFTSRAMLINLRAVLQELALMAPLAGGAWWLTRTRRNRGRTSGPDARRRPSAGAAGTAGTSDRRGPRAAP